MKFAITTVEVDGKTVFRAESSSDIILIWHSDDALAVLKLKRQVIGLSSADEQ